jgi:hypothetical protein
VANGITKALEQAAERIGTKISKEAAKAVEDMYRGAGGGAKKVADNVAKADDAHKREILALAEKIAKNSGETGEGARARIVAQADARIKLASAVGHKGDYDAEMIVDKASYPESAQHIKEAQAGMIWRGSSYTQGNPLPSVLTIEKSGAKKNRRLSLRGIRTRNPDERDEYPPAMFKEGGTGASVKYIDGSDNGGSGSQMGSALRGLPDGYRVKITVK